MQVDVDYDQKLLSTIRNTDSFRRIKGQEPNLNFLRDDLTSIQEKSLDNKSSDSQTEQTERKMQNLDKIDRKQGS